MNDPRLAKLARVLVRYSVGVRRDDKVVIKGYAVTEPLLAALCREVLLAGGHPLVQMQSELCRDVFFEHAAAHQLAFLSPLERFAVKDMDVFIGIWGDGNSRALSRVDPARQAAASQARKPYMTEFMKRTGLPPDHKRHLRWVGTAYPTAAQAQDAEMSLSQYAEFVFRAGKLHLPDPAAAWRKAGVAQRRLADHLAKCRELHITTPRGTDIRFGIAGRRWISCDGHENFPDGEVFTAPLENATEGTVVYDVPSVFGGRELQNIRLTFKAGRVVDASADKNGAYLHEMLDQDRGARALGEVALGTNYEIRQPVRDTLFDEKIGGTFHAAVGASIPEAGGRNVSALHWDMVCDLRRGGRVWADGKLISKDGRFQRASWPR